MTDIFREVDEEVRQDRVQIFLARYWVALLVLVLLIIGSVGGWRAYGYWRQQQAEASGGQYLDALKLARDNKGEAAIAALDALAKSGTPGYRLLSRFRVASQTGLNNPQDAVKAFDALAADPSIDPAWQDVARLRAGVLLVDSADLKEMRRRLDPLADANNALRDPAREILAVAALKVDDFKAAGQWLDAIVTDAGTTATARQRAESLLGLVRSGQTAKSG